MNRKVILFISLLIFLSLNLTVYAVNEENHTIIGAWKLDRIYEYASTENPAELDPESAASLYAEQNNIYSFYSEQYLMLETINTAEGSHRETAHWEETKDGYFVHYSEGLEYLFFLDEENYELHRYWIETAPDAMYHDLDFVYTRVPAGSWMMREVYTQEPDQVRSKLDPSTNQSLYSESSNVYFLNDNWTAQVMVIDGSDIYWTEKGNWTKDGNTYFFDVEDFEMELQYDPSDNTLHRYWTDESGEGSWRNLEFVYHCIIPI